MRILVLSHLYPSPANGNAGIFVQEQVLALRALGHDVRVMSPRGWAPPLARWSTHRSIPTHEVREGVMVDYPKRIVLPRGLLGRWSADLMARAIAGPLAALHRSWGIDVIHAHTIAPDGVAAIAVGHRLGVPVVATAHGADVRELPARSAGLRAQVGQAIAGADQLVAVSGAIRAMIERLGRPRRPVVVIPNGADTERFRPGDAAAARRRLGLPVDAPLLVWVGAFKPIKGPDVLVEAMGLLGDQAPHLVLVGVGPMRRAMETRLAELGLSGRVRFTGRVPHREVPTWFTASDVMVLPSRGEGLPTAACEAAASGRPLVAAAVGGTPEVVADGETGLLVPPEDPAALAGAVAALLGDPARAAAMGRAARTRAEERFNWRANARAMDAVYRAVT